MENQHKCGALGSWLCEWSWDWWATLTFRYPVTPAQAHRAWIKLLHALEGEIKGKVHYVRSTELQRFRGDVPHYHVLFKGVKDLDTHGWEHFWWSIAGLARIEQYDLSLGATFYLSKNAGTETGDIIFSKNLEKVKDNHKDLVLNRQ